MIAGSARGSCLGRLSISAFALSLRPIAEGTTLHPKHFTYKRNVPSSSTVRLKYTQLEHWDFESYQDHVLRKGGSMESATYKGTGFEYATRRALSRLYMDLERIGGRGDEGIDLRGSWTLPTLPRRYSLDVLVQCKSLKTKVSPSVIRDLRGTCASLRTQRRPLKALPAESVGNITEDMARMEKKEGVQDLYGEHDRRRDIMGLLATNQNPTEGVRRAMLKCDIPMGFVVINEKSFTVESLLLNAASFEVGLAGITVGYRHKPTASEESLTDIPNLEQEAFLQWNGKPYERVDVRRATTK